MATKPEVLAELRKGLKSSFPLSGPHYVLGHKTYADGTHYIVAKNHASLMPAFKYALAHDHSAEPTSGFSCTIVAPTEAVRDKYADFKFESEVIQFKSYVSDLVERYLDDFGSYPEGLKKCDDYKPAFDYTPDEDDITNHRQCLNCGWGKVALQSGTWEDAYLERRSLYLAKTAPKPNPRYKPPTQYDCPLPADPSKPLYGFGANFGPHCCGVENHREDLESYSFGSILLFYQDPVDFDISEFTSLSLSAKKSFEEKQKLEEKSRKAFYKKARKQDHSLLEQFFPPKGYK